MALGPNIVWLKGPIGSISVTHPFSSGYKITMFAYDLTHLGSAFTFF